MKWTFALLMSILLLSSCINEDNLDPEDNIEEEYSENCMTAQIDGQNFEACSSFVQGGLTYLDQEQYACFVLGSQHHNTDVSKTITVHFSDMADFNEVQAGDEFFPDDDYGGEGSYAVDGENILARSDTAFYMMVTEIDHPNKLISGEFHFTAFDDDTGINYEITNGVFTNASFDN